MRTTTLTSLGRCVAVLAMLTLACPPVGAEFRQGDDFKSDEPIESLTVRVDVGPGGVLEEPLALDLGLGFPFWLYPVGYSPGDPVPFGAVPQTSTATERITAGSSGTFTFNLEADPGQDVFRTTSQLMQGIQVSDIARIGFLTECQTGWGIAAYEIEINGRLFAANDDVGLPPLASRAGVNTRIAEIVAQGAPLQTEVQDLEALVTTGLATDAEQQQLQKLRDQLAPLASERRRLEAQLAGKYPWFEEPAFAPAFRAETAIATAQVTLVTEDHSGAGTQNYVYFRTGGRKFLLGSPEYPLTSQAGPQVFDLDLSTGPMTTADLRGTALGMLGHSLPYAEAPDRWHPKRVLVSMDDRIVYDSEENSVDLKSLEAIRLVPPAHTDKEGKIVENQLSAREFNVWEAGKALGLDLESGGPAPLPDLGDHDYPKPEPPGPEIGGDPKPDPFDPLPPPGPGNPPPGPGGASPGPGDPWPGPGGPSPGPGGPWSGPGGPWGGTIGDLLALLRDLLQGFGNWWGGPGPGPGPGPNPPPPSTAGQHAKIENVRITSGWREDQPFIVEWDVHGPEKEVAYYQVEVLEFHPEAAGFQVGNPLNAPHLVQVGGPYAPDVYLAGPVPKGTCFVIPRVTVRPVDPNATNQITEFGPAVPVFPAYVDKTFDNIGFYDHFQYTDANNQSQELLFGKQPSPNRAVWTFGRAQTHIGLEMDSPTGQGPAYNVALRPDKNDKSMRIVFGRMFTGKVRMTAFLGLAMGDNGNNAVKVTTDFQPWAVAPVQPGTPLPAIPPQILTGPQVTLVNQVGQPGEPMKVLEHVIDFPDIEKWYWAAFYTVTIEGGTVDPDHPPALFGVRIIPEK